MYNRMSYCIAEINFMVVFLLTLQKKIGNIRDQLRGNPAKKARSEVKPTKMNGYNLNAKRMPKTGCKYTRYSLNCMHVI